MRERTLQLLKEINEVCSEEKIPYFLSGEFALRLYREESIDDTLCDGTIMIFAKDADRLCRELRAKKKQRIVESLETNKSFPGFYLRYMNPDTTMIYCRDDRVSYKTNSIGIDIELICGIHQGWKGKVFHLLKTTWCGRFQWPRRKPAGKKKRLLQGVAGVLLKIAGSSMGMKKLFSKWIELGTVESKKVAIALNSGKTVRFPIELFSSVTMEVIDGTQFPVVKELGQFTRELYSKGSKPKAYKDFICDPCVPWSQYRKRLDAQKINLKRVKKRQRAYQQWKETAYLPLFRKRSYYYNLIFCSGDRVAFWRKYGKDKLITAYRLYSEGKYSKLRDEICDYLEKLRYYAKKGIGFCFDPELLKIGMKLLIMEDTKQTQTEKGYRQACEKWMKLVRQIPYQHFDKIDCAFMGKKTEKILLEKQKKKLCDELNDFCNHYYTEKMKEWSLI